VITSGRPIATPPIRSESDAPIDNRLLGALPVLVRKRLHAMCEPIELIPAEILHEAGARLRHVYFPTGGSVSMITSAETCAGIEVQLVGREGMVGISLLMGVAASSLNHIVHGGGGALRISTPGFHRELKRSRALRSRLGRYAHVSVYQLAQIAACIRFHTVEQRLARWLLMADDRARPSPLRATHLALAKVLGVRRSGITTAAATLQLAALIRYSRGGITILDRAGLQARACGCYAAADKMYDRMLGPRDEGVPD